MDCADILVLNMQSDTHSVSLLAIENILLFILLIPPERAHATAFVNIFIEFINRFHGFRTFGPNLEPFIVRKFHSEICLVVNQIFTVPQRKVPVVARESLVLILLTISDSDTRNEFFDS